VIGLEFDIALLQAIHNVNIITDIKILVEENFIFQSSPASYLFRSEAACKVSTPVPICASVHQHQCNPVHDFN
jgi:hypothetical protein